MLHKRNLPGVARSFLACSVLALAVTCTSQAVQTTTTPNAFQVFYSLNPNTTTVSYTTAANVPVHLMGTCITPGTRGVGSVSLLRIPGAFVEWVGLNSPSNGTITQGFSGTEGTNIVQLDFGGSVYVEVGNVGGAGNGTRDSIRVINTGASLRQGYLTLIW